MEKRVKVVIDGDSKGGEASFNSINNLASKARGEISSFNSTLSTMGSILSAGGIVVAINTANQAANQLERSNIALAVTARYAGAGMAEANTAARTLAEDGLMSVSEASQALQNLLSRGFTLEESIALMNRLKDAAAFNRQAHLEFGQSIVGATEGLKNENSVLVDNAGVTKNVSMMWKEYAAEHGRSVDQLTQAEKRQAEYNGILRETEGQVGNTARMMDTASGAQARLNQQMFESKSAFGTALQPVLKATFDLLGPIVKGFRDIVYWIETLGPRAGATVDKLRIAKDIMLSGKGLFSAEGQAEYDRQTAPINATLDEMIADIVRRADGGQLPDIGADTGKRRQDIVLPAKGGRSGGNRGGGSSRRGVEDYLDASISQYAGFFEAGQADLTYQTPGQQTLSLFGPGGLDAFLPQAATEKQTYLDWTEQVYLQQNALEEAMLQQRNDRHVQMEKEKAQRLADLWWNNAQTYIGFAEQMTTMGLQYLFFEEDQKNQIGRRMLATSIRFIAQGLQQYMFGKAKENLLNAAAAAGRISTDMTAGNANLGILQAQSTAWAAFFVAMSMNPYGGQAFIPAATAMTAVAGVAVPGALAAVNAVGATSIAGSLGTAAAWTAGGIAAGALGEAGASAIEGGTAGGTGPAGYGGGSYGSPVVTQPIGAIPTQGPGEITIRVVGVISEAVVEDTLIPMINRAGGRNVKIEYV